MTKQEIAKAIDKLNWGNIQCDNPADGAQLAYLNDRLMELEKQDAIDVLIAVIEAQNLPNDFMGEDRIMHEFEHLK